MYLNCHSYYSLRYGTLTVEDLVTEAQKCSLHYLALTDINCTTGVFDFTKACLEQKIKPIVGCEFRKEGQLLYIGLAQNLDGLRELNELLTKTNLGEKPLPLQSPFFEHVFVIYPTSNIPEILQAHEYIGIKASALKRFKHPLLKRLDKLVCLQPVTYRNAQEHELHRLLRCIDHNILLSYLQPEQAAESNENMLPKDEIESLFGNYPEIIRNTHRLADQCEFEFNFEEPKNKRTFTNSVYEDKVLLESLALEGFKDRYQVNDKKALARLYEELEVIHKLQFGCYFLTTWDIVRHSLNHGYFHVGRGSGANSMVAYCLKITEVDPIELNLYFSRFLNTKRSSPPDFDIDWSWQDRDDIIA
ncbi:MAG: PHP domain-containing protein, partial [Bacteroidota bacterium]